MIIETRSSKEVKLKNIIRLKVIDVKNVKNISRGRLTTNSEFETIENSDIVGFYGQNGSGKTAMVEAFKLFKNLISISKLPNISRHLMHSGKNFIGLEFELLIRNRFGEYIVKYSSNLKIENDIYVLSLESLYYKENKKGKRFKTLVLKEEDEIFLRNANINKIKEDIRLKLMVSNEISKINSTSFILRSENFKIYEEMFLEHEVEIIKNIAIDFNRDFHVIDNEEQGLVLANVLMPFNIDFNDKYSLEKSMLLNRNSYRKIVEVIEQINIVLEKMIPELKIIVNEINIETGTSGEEQIRFEFLSSSGGINLPLRCESDGILKLISILSTLISVYNNPNATIVIDELDAGVFEYLLGEILEVIDAGGKGQLFFTSHNLRILEVLDNKSIWFTTLNADNRLIQLKGVKKYSNARDIYLRAVQLGGQNEELYKTTNHYDIKKAFRKAGELDV